MTQTFKVLSALLSYPSADLQGAASELRSVLASEALLRPAVAAGLDKLIDEIATADLLDAQERYVQLFDQGRAQSLHLFEHVHGESRDRGQAMIDLQAVYESNGLTVAAAELPDYLPLLLEFLSTRPLAAGREMLGQTSHILSVLGQRLKKRGSSYAAVFDALMELAVVTAGAEDAGLVRADEGATGTDYAALDAEWEETAVMFGPQDSSGCATAARSHPASADVRTAR